MSAPPGFAQKVADYSNLQLAEVLASSPDYTPEALAIVMAEWQKRKLTPDAVAPELARTYARQELASAPNPTKPMAVKGVGFICYGRDFRQGIGYVTTQWFCFFFVPLIPTRSFHVAETSIGAGGIATAIPLHSRQVIRTYLFLTLLIGSLFPAIWLVSKMYDAGYEFGALAATGLLILVPIFSLQFLRRNARQRQPKGDLS